MDRLVRVAKALADINRLKVLAFIAQNKEVCVCEVSQTLGYSQPLASKYLKQLKSAGIIKSQRKGKWSIYSLDDTKLIDPFLDELKNVTLPKIQKCVYY